MSTTTANFVVYPCDRGTGNFAFYHHYVSDTLGRRFCEYCGKLVPAEPLKVTCSSWTYTCPPSSYGLWLSHVGGVSDSNV